MRRFFAKNLLFTIITNVLVMPAWVFLIARTVQNRVAPEEFGTYSSLYSFSLIFVIIREENWWLVNMVATKVLS